jgi:hypothetical protein
MDDNEFEIQTQIKPKKGGKKQEVNYSYKLSSLDSDYDLLSRFDDNGKLKLQRKINNYDELFSSSKELIITPPKRGAVKDTIIVKDKDYVENHLNLPNKSVVVQQSSLFKLWLDENSAPKVLSEEAINGIKKVFDTL